MKNIKIYNKDSKEISKFVKDKVQFIVFSPPYWNLRNYKIDNQIGFKQTYDEYLNSMFSVFKECYSVLDEGRFMAINIGTVVLDLSIYKTKICKSTFKCISGNEFNEQYLDKSYSSDFLYTLFTNKKIYFKDKTHNILIKVK